VRARREFDAAGRPRRTFGVVIDVTERKRAEEQRALLAREVDHRARNTLAVVQAVMKLTRADDPRAFAETVEGRIAALAHAHTLLAADRWAGADLHTLLELELRPFGGGTAGGGGRLVLAGRAVALAPEAAQPLSLTLHELATNAAKYGALSASDGRLAVRRRLDPANGALRLRWVETGGPRLNGPPAAAGFGTRIIEQSLHRQLGGTIRRRWEPDGLICEITVPADRVRRMGTA
jgi:two-component sensor histidine kinase